MKRPRPVDGFGHGILAAALVLPGIQGAQADTPPERASISWKYLDYQDMQPGWDRIGVKASAVSILAPVAGDWSVGGSLTRDAVSGASPAFHSEELLSGEMEEDRYGRDLQITRYFQRGSLSAGVTDSQESDYTARGYSLTGTWSTESKNTTLSAGLGSNHDRVDVGTLVSQESKDVDSWTLGVAQVLSPVDVVQLNYSRAEGRGYFSDPYKYRDNRPHFRQQDTLYARWNHHFRAADGSLRLGYRYYVDSFAIDSHMVEAEYVQRLPGGWSVAPGLRFYTQSDASFYLDPQIEGFPRIRARDRLQSQDQRLSSFGAVTCGLKLRKELGPDWAVDMEYQRYEQRADWFPFGAGSPGIEDFRANYYQFGLTWSFL